MVLFSSLKTPAIIVQWNSYSGRRWKGLYAVQVVRITHGQTRSRNSPSSARKALSFLFCVKYREKYWYDPRISCLFELQHQVFVIHRIYCYNCPIFLLLLLFFRNIGIVIISIVIVFLLMLLSVLIFYLTVRKYIGLCLSKYFVISRMAGRYDSQWRGFYNKLRCCYFTIFLIYLLLVYNTRTNNAQ